MVMASVIFEDQLEIPMDIHSLDDFRQWALAKELPERGRIDYIAGRIEVDMTFEDLFCHGTLKTELLRVVGQRVKTTRRGHLFTDRTRVSSPAADLSAGPDLVFVSHESIASGRVRLVPKASGEPGRYIELEGAVDLIAEIVSDSSVTKDTRRLPRAYHQAGVREFWLVDARGDDLRFQIYHAGEAQFEPGPADADGYQYSAVLEAWYRLERYQDPQGLWTYDLLEKAV